MDTLTRQEIQTFADSFKTTELKNNLIHFGSFFIKAKKIQGQELANFSGIDLLDFKQQYEIKIKQKTIKFYIQLYENITSAGNKQFRLAAYSTVDKTMGMVFTINLSKQKDAEGQLFLLSKFTFTQQPKGHKELTNAHRKLKQQLFSDILNNLDFDLTDNNDIIFGVFDLNKKVFLNTTSAKFLQDFLIVSILKGHFMANKGYEIELLPSFKNIDTEISTFETDDKNIEAKLPTILKEQRAKRAISLSLRYKVFHRDKSKCLKCGNTPNDHIKLHVDHIKPHSKGGLTVLSNLRTLCNECNLGRSNKYDD